MRNKRGISSTGIKKGAVAQWHATRLYYFGSEFFGSKGFLSGADHVFLYYFSYIFYAAVRDVSGAGNSLLAGFGCVSVVKKVITTYRAPQ